ncbi:hypothetical protein [Thalassospira sp. UBA1131]|uniref:hypothetical protein n=1 Tax=Thalassospira sp. UBA1131 TaxID=1947672 RepID=UPI0025F95E9E|nr:hypothetical protein [Thalassospira sp. UBA1131]
MSEASFKTILTTLRDAANDNLGCDDTARQIINDLDLGGFAIRRSYEVVNYDLPVLVLHQPVRGSGESFGGNPVMKSPSAADLNGETGWLVSWVEHGRTKCAWFDGEGTARKLPDYRVINPKTPCAGAKAARAAIGKAA